MRCLLFTDKVHIISFRCLAQLHLLLQNFSGPAFVFCPAELRDDINSNEKTSTELKISSPASEYSLQKSQKLCYLGLKVLHIWPKSSFISTARVDTTFKGDEARKKHNKMEIFVTFISTHTPSLPCLALQSVQRKAF